MRLENGESWRMGNAEKLTGGPREALGGCCFACHCGQDKPCPLDPSLGLLPRSRVRTRQRGALFSSLCTPFIGPAFPLLSGLVGRKAWLTTVVFLKKKKKTTRKQALNSLTASNCWMGNKKAWDASEDVEAGPSGWLVTVQTLTIKVRPTGQGGWGC